LPIDRDFSTIILWAIFFLEESQMNRMNSILKAVVLFSVSSFVQAAPVNTAFGSVTDFVPRDSGHQSVFLYTAPGGTNLVSAVAAGQGCTVSDRGIIDPSLTGANSFVASIMLAVSSGYQVSLRVDGCVLVNPTEDQVTTAPKITKVGLKLQ
jgi:hypothetical protein